jgi:hypothetical protein
VPAIRCGTVPRWGQARGERTFAALQQTLGNEQIVDLTITITLYNAVVRVLATLLIDVEDDYMPNLRQFPLPSDRRST